MGFKILFSPSEGKNYPENHKKESYGDNSALFELPLISPDAIKAYIATLCSADESTICKILGRKNIDLEELALLQNMLNAPRLESVRLYNGVAYKALDFETLDTKAKRYIYENMYIFSNLFGTLKASDCVPYYNLHQTQGFGDFGLHKIYADTKALLDAEFYQKEILDLRADIYIKAYPINTCSMYYKVVFTKNGKKISHYAKLYRGLYVRSISKLQILSLEELQHLEYDFMCLKKIEHTQNATTLIYDILS